MYKLGYVGIVDSKKDFLNIRREGTRDLVTIVTMLSFCYQTMSLSTYDPVQDGFLSEWATFPWHPYSPFMDVELVELLKGTDKCGICNQVGVVFTMTRAGNVRVSSKSEMLFNISPRCHQCRRYFHLYCSDIKDSRVYRFLGNIRNYWRCPDCIHISGLERYKYMQDRIMYLQACEKFQMLKKATQCPC